MLTSEYKPSNALFRLTSVALFSIVAILIVSICQASITTQAQSPGEWLWRNITPTEGASPEPRRNGRAIYDPLNKRIIVFGGIGQRAHLNDLWAFSLESNSWTRLEASGAPPAGRLGHDAIYDPVAHQLVVWAGQQGSRFFNDTWVLDLSTLQWRDVSPSARPKARYGSASVFDPVARQLVQFAGFTDEFRRFQDTQGFELASNTWIDRTPEGDKPQVRCLLTASLHSDRRHLIIYGGQRNGPLDDLWSFDLNANTWLDLTPAQRPPGRFFASSFVARDGRFYVFGGATVTGNVNEIWAFDFATGQWSQIATEAPPSPRNGMMTAYVESEDRLIMFGGLGSQLLNDVWELVRSRPPDPPAAPEVVALTRSGKNLIVTGRNFDNAPQILRNGEPQKTKLDSLNPTTALIGKKLGKRILPGDKVKVRNSDGAESNEVIYP